MANITNIDIDGLAGNEAAQPRVFAHSATPILGANIVGEAPAGQQVVVTTGTPAAGETVDTLSRGACVYVGIAGNITVVMEGQPSDTTFAKSITFYGVTAGSFLPILVTKIWKIEAPAGTEAYTAADVEKRIIALF